MQKLSYIILFVLLTFNLTEAKAQSSNFTQYHLTPIYTSPGELATSDYLQVYGHYRKQSLSNDQGYQNMAVSGIYPLHYKDGGRRYGGIGLGLMKETSGMMGLLNEISIRTGYAYNWQISGKQFLSFGLQGGYYNRNIDASKISTDQQYLNGAYDPGSATGENFFNEVSHAFKADAGATWYMLNDEGRRMVSTGIAAFNINKANYEQLQNGQQASEPVRYLIYGSLLAYEWDRVQVEPTFRYMFERNYGQLNLGALFLYRFPPSASSTAENHLGLGVWYSLNNAAIFSLQLMQDDYIVAISYDLPTSSKVDQIQVNNGVEVTLGWRFNKKK